MLDRETVLNMEAGPELDDLLRPMCKKQRRRPTHGTCCTCQDCGWGHDDCVCGWSPSTDPAADYEVLVFVRENWDEAKRLTFGFELSATLDARWREKDFGDVETAGYFYQPGDYSRAALLTTLEAKETDDG